jgi:hypothetical protein
MLQWSMDELAAKAGVSVSTIRTAKAVYLTWEHRQGNDLTPKSRVMAFEPVAAELVEAA